MTGIIGHAIDKFFYNFLIHGLGWLIQGIGDAINWLGNQNLVGLILNTQGHRYTHIPYYEVLGYFGVAVFVILGGFMLIKSVESGTSQQTIARLGKGFILFVFWVLAVPFLAFILNFFTRAILTVIFKSPVTGQGLADQIAGIGWYNPANIPPGWHYQDYPNFDQYSTSIAACALVATGIMFLLLSVALVRRVFTIIVYMSIAPVVVAKCSATNQWGSFITWKDNLVATFLSVFGIFLSFNLFIVLLPKIMVLINNTDVNLATKTALKVIFVVGGAYSTYVLAHELQDFAGGKFNLRESGQPVKTAKKEVGKWVKAIVTKKPPLPKVKP